MARPKTDELTRHAMFLFTGDFEKLKHLFPDVGAAYIVRHLVRNTIKKIEGEAVTASPPVIPINLDL